MILILQLVKCHSMTNDSEAESIKDVDNIIVPPDWCMHSYRMIRFNTTFSDYILVDSSIQFLWRLNTVNMLQTGVRYWCMSALLRKLGTGLRLFSTLYGNTSRKRHFFLPHMVKDFESWKIVNFIELIG